MDHHCRAVVRDVECSDMLGRNLSALVTKMVRFDTEKAIAIEVLADGSEPKLVTMFVSYLTHDGPTVGEFDPLHRDRANRAPESESICRRVCSPEDGCSPQPSNASPAGPFLSHRIAHHFGTVAVFFCSLGGPFRSLKRSLQFYGYETRSVGSRRCASSRCKIHDYSCVSPPQAGAFGQMSGEPE